MFFSVKEIKAFLERGFSASPSPLPAPAVFCYRSNIRLDRQNTNAVAEATSYVAVLTKADTNKEPELNCVGFAFVFANLRFVCHDSKIMRILLHRKFVFSFKISIIYYDETSIKYNFPQ